MQVVKTRTGFAENDTVFRPMSYSLCIAGSVALTLTESAYFKLVNQLAGEVFTSKLFNGKSNNLLILPTH